MYVLILFKAEKHCSHSAALTEIVKFIWINFKKFGNTLLSGDNSANTSITLSTVLFSRQRLAKVAFI